ncbi:MAG: acyltransferase family protein [Treponema sp.]
MELQSRIIDENTSKRITALRFLLMIFVVFIHNNFTVESIAESVANGGIAPLFNQGVVGKWIQLFISDGIGRGAVPLFMLFAAYLQVKKNDSYSSLLKKKAKSLLVPYALWMAFYIFLYGGLKLIALQIAPQFVSHPESTILSWSMKEWIHNVLGYDNYFGGEAKPPRIIFQFWFLRELMILIALSPILKFFVRKYPASFLFAISFFYIVPIQMYFIATQALF